MLVVWLTVCVVLFFCCGTHTYTSLTRLSLSHPLRLQIGPQAIAENVNVFQSGKVALQGFTVVFGVFIVPIPQDISRFRLNDAPENVKEFVRWRLGGGGRPATPRSRGGPAGGADASGGNQGREKKNKTNST